MYDIRNALYCPIIEHTLIVCEIKKIIFEKDNFYIFEADVIESNTDLGEKYKNKKLETIIGKGKGIYNEKDMYLIYGDWENNKEYGWNINIYHTVKIEQTKITDKDCVYNILLNYPYNIRKQDVDYLYNKYGVNTLDKLENDTYSLVQDTEIFDFDTTDNLHRRTNKRLFSLIYSTVKECCSLQGHLVTSKEEIIEKLKNKKINIGSIELEIIILDMILSGKLYIESNNIANEDIFEQEFSTALYAINLMSKPFINIKNIDNQIKEIENEISLSIGKEFKYADKQKEAMYMLSKGNFLVITGGPGTGKSTIIKALRNIILKNKPNAKILMAAPTGRASKRMEEATHCSSSTIHRLLCYIPGKGFTHNIQDKIDCDVLIIDESSMIDSFLMFSLLQSISSVTMLILIGDIDQLPPVGAGYPFKDLIESNIITTVKLNQTFRQNLNSIIKSNAYKIIEGNYNLDKKDNEFEIINENIESKIQNIVINKYIEALKEENMDKNKIKNEIYNVQVLTPMRIGNLGVNYLNTLIQQEVNPFSPEKPELKIHVKEPEMDIIYRLNDKVMQTINNYDKDVYNGDLGIITGIDSNKIFVTFEDNTVIEYSYSEIEDNIILSYVTTIHKSQGSEYNQVIVLNSIHHKNMLQRNLLYTAITRAKKKVILIGDEKAIKISVLNTNACKRNTNLKEMIEEIYLNQQLLNTR